MFPSSRSRVVLAAAAFALLISGTTTPAIAQEAPPVAKTHAEPGLVPEPRFMTTAFDFAGKYIGSGETDKDDGFRPIFRGLIHSGSDI